MNKPYIAWRLTSLLVILLLSTAVIVSIISVNQPFANSLSQNHFTLRIMLLFYGATFLAGFLGRLILSQYTVFLGCIFTLIGLTLLSLTTSVIWGTTFVIAGTSMLYINLINLCFAVSDTANMKRIVVALLIYLVLLTSTFSYPMASILLQKVGAANTYLVIGIVSAIVLFLYVFIEHFVVNPVLHNRHSLMQYNYWQITGLIGLVLLVLYLIHYSLNHMVATSITCAAMGLIVIGYLCVKKHFMWLFVSLIFFAYWFNANIHFNVIHGYHHFLHSAGWRFSMYGIGYTKLYSFSSIVLILLGILLAIAFKWMPGVRKLSSYHGVLIGIYLGALSSFFPWLGSTLHAHGTHILPWPWLMVTMITQSASNLMLTVSATALCTQWFRGEQRLMLLGSITTISGVALLCSHHFMDFFLPIHHTLHAQYFQIEPPLMLALSLLDIVWAILLSVVLKTHYRHTKSFDLYVAN